jgi:hypothetical protein
MQAMRVTEWAVWQTWRSKDLMSEASPEIFRHLLRHRRSREWHESHRNFLPEPFRAVMDAVAEELGRIGKIGSVFRASDKYSSDN